MTVTLIAELDGNASRKEPSAQGRCRRNVISLEIVPGGGQGRIVEERAILGIPRHSITWGFMSSRAVFDGFNASEASPLSVADIHVSALCATS